MDIFSTSTFLEKPSYLFYKPGFMEKVVSLVKMGLIYNEIIASL